MMATHAAYPDDWVETAAPRRHAAHRTSRRSNALRRVRETLVRVGAGGARVHRCRQPARRPRHAPARPAPIPVPALWRVARQQAAGERAGTRLSGGGVTVRPARPVRPATPSLARQSTAPRARCARRGHPSAAGAECRACGRTQTQLCSAGEQRDQSSSGSCCLRPRSNRPGSLGPSNHKPQLPRAGDSWRASGR
jgi:hypothetical protein